MANSNIAPLLGTVVSYSSQWNASTRAAANIIDGLPVNQAAVALEDYTIYATGEGNISDEWIIIDLGQSRTLSGFALWGSATPGDICVKVYRVGLDDSLTGAFVNIVVEGQINFPTFYFGGSLQITRDYHQVAPQSARFVKLFLDTNHGSTSAIESVEFEIIGVDVQQDVVSVYSNAETYVSPATETILSDAYLIPPIVYKEIASVRSNAEITTLRKDVLSDAYIVNAVTSDATILGQETATVTSSASIFHRLFKSVDTFMSGRGDHDGFPTVPPMLVYNTSLSAAEETVVKDTIVSAAAPTTRAPGSLLDLATLTPPLGYTNYEWKYDWVVRTYNAAQYKFEIRAANTVLDLSAETFSRVTLGQTIPIGSVKRYYQWRCHVWASGSGDFELHQFSIKGYVDHPSNILYSALNPGQFTTVSRICTGIAYPYEPMDMSDIWGGSYIPGDANNNGLIEYDDLTAMVNYMFNGGPLPAPVRRLDVNDTGAVDISDLLYFVNYHISNGPPPRRFGATGLE